MSQFPPNANDEAFVSSKQASSARVPSQLVLGGTSGGSLQTDQFSARIVQPGVRPPCCRRWSCEG